jgi:hypothetical protein
MKASSSIQYLEQKEIDKQKWDACITSAENGLIYGYADFLDTMAGDWDALIMGDYEAVMPLPWRKKYGIRYIYQPAFVAQLGVFGNNTGSDTLHQFLKAIPSSFKFIDLPFNHQNRFEAGDYQTRERVNYVLDLHLPYEEIYSKYRDNIRRNIKKSVGYGCSFSLDVSLDDIIELASMNERGGSQTNDFRNFKILAEKLRTDNKALNYGILSNNGQLLASAVFFFSHQRAYYLLVGNHPNGRTLGASHALVDAFIRNHAGRDLLLDFEGSDIRNLAFFYSSFGAVEESYLSLQWNRLPWYLRWVKG